MSASQSVEATASVPAMTEAEIEEGFSKLAEKFKTLDQIEPLSLYARREDSQAEPSNLAMRESGHFYGTTDADIINVSDRNTIILPGAGRDEINLGSGINMIVYYEGRWEIFHDDRDRITNFDPTKNKIVLYDVPTDLPLADPEKTALTVHNATKFSGEAREWIINKSGTNEWDAYYNFSGRREDTSIPTPDTADVRLKIYTTGDLTAENFTHYPVDFVTA